MLEKQRAFRHWINENGHLDVRIVTKYINDGGKIDFEELDPPTNQPAMTPVDTSKMDDWDNRSKEIVLAITDPKMLADLEVEKVKGIIIKGKTYKHPSQITGMGVEKTCSYDCEIESDGKILGRYIFRIFDDGVKKKKSYLRHDVMPGIATIYGGIMSKTLAKKLHTSEVVKAYKARVIQE